MAHRRKNKRLDDVSKLDEFPDDFSDVYFHNQTVEADKRIPILRNIVYKKIRDSIIDRIVDYKDKIPLNDTYNIEFTIGEFNEFQWGVIRDELQNLGFDPYFEWKDADNSLHQMIVPIERKLDLEETRLEKIKREEEENGEFSDDDCEGHDKRNL